MASKSKLCCTAEEEEDDRESSPQLPNVRVSEVTPAKRPLLHKKIGSQGSRFTSARSDDLHELRQIFENAKDPSSKESPPSKSRPSRFGRPSIYSLHSLNKIGSVQGLLKRRLSRNLTKSTSDAQPKADGMKKNGAGAEPDTVVKALKNGPNLQLKITKTDLRKDLLSDKRPEEGGYDSDAEVLHDIARKVSKKLPNKRPSLRSIDWTPSPGSMQTPESTKHYHTSDANSVHRPYQLKPHELTGDSPRTARFTSVFSSPNLRLHPPKCNRKLRRSHSATSIDLPISPSPSPPIRLPSIKGDEVEGVSWGVSMHESLRLSRFQVSPVHLKLNSPPSKSSLRVNQSSSDPTDQKGGYRFEPPKTSSPEVTRNLGESVSSPPVSETQTHESTAPTRIPTSGDENTTPWSTEDPQGSRNDVGNHSRSSVHLPNMRISHHLRSGSLLSWGDLADAPEIPAPPNIFHERSVSDQSRASRVKGRSRHNRQTSSSGFASTKVPSKWGNVVPHSHEDMSSIYSSRPHSPPDSLGGSMGNLSIVRPLPKSTNLNITSSPADSVPTDDDETPRPPKRYGLTNFQPPKDTSVNDSFLNGLEPARNNSVALTKKSKFREDFNLTPPRKRYTAGLAIKNIFRPLNAMRSQSDTNLKQPHSHVDGPSDALEPPPHRSRGMSVSLMSLQKDQRLEVPEPTLRRARGMSVSQMSLPKEQKSLEQDKTTDLMNLTKEPKSLGKDKAAELISLEKEQRSLGKDKSADPMWDRALKQHQDERSSFFISEDKTLAARASPFRQRSGSIISRPKTPISPSPFTPKTEVDASPFGSGFRNTFLEEEEDDFFKPRLVKRRTAIVEAHDWDLDPSHEVRTAFDRQTDTAETVGAWGRYPSHTRRDRTSSAGHMDSVRTRDFALEAAIKPAIKEEESIDPTARPESPLTPGKKRRKKRVGSNRMTKSHSMTFGKQFIKNYTRIFRSQSTEFQRHGYGHRSSIAAGGMLEFPELEILPHVWTGIIPEDAEQERSESRSARSARSARREARSSSKQEIESTSNEPTPKPKGKQRAENSSDLSHTSRPKFQLKPDYTLDGVIDEIISKPTDRARVWSTYYEDCIPTYPRTSTDIGRRSFSLSRNNLNDVLELEEFGAGQANKPNNAMRHTNSTRHSFDSKRASMHSRTLPARLRSHRNRQHQQRLSVASICSGTSIVPSFVSIRDGDEVGDSSGGIDDQSIVSVRQSTMDLITLYRQQEITERERVLSLFRVESMRAPVQEAGV